MPGKGKYKSKSTKSVKIGFVPPAISVVTEAYVARRGNVKLETVSYAELGPKDTLIDIVAASICDIDILSMNGYGGPPPLILGHEAAGYVRRVGDEVTYVKPGDAVVLIHASCGECDMCTKGANSWCRNFDKLNMAGRVPPNWRSRDPFAAIDSFGKAIGARYNGQSSLSRIALVHESCCVKVECRSPQELALFANLGCDLRMAAGNVLCRVAPPPGSSIVVFGAGASGLATVLAAKATAPSSLILVESMRTKLDAIPKEVIAGVHVITSAKVGGIEDLAKTIRRLSATGDGVDYFFNCIANNDMIAVGQAALRKSALQMHIGTPGVNVRKGNTCCHVHPCDSFVPRVTIPWIIGLWREGDFPFEILLTRYRFEELDRAVSDLQIDKIVKPLVLL